MKRFSVGLTGAALVLFFSVPSFSSDASEDSPWSAQWPQTKNNELPTCVDSADLKRHARLMWMAGDRYKRTVLAVRIWQKCEDFIHQPHIFFEPEQEEVII